VTKLTGTLASADGTWSAPVIWAAFETPGDVGKPGKMFTPWWTFAGWVSPMIAPSRKAITTWITFSISPIPGILAAGEYRLSLAVITGDEARPTARWSGGFALGDQDAATLRDSCVAVHNVDPDRLPVPLKRS
jgi:hypothetical protein